MRTKYEVVTKDKDEVERVFTKEPLHFDKAIAVVDVIRYWDGVDDIIIREVKNA